MTRTKSVSFVVGAAVASFGVVALASGCNDTAAPLGKGNTIVNDTRDSSVRAISNPDDGAAPTGEPDGDLLVEADGAAYNPYADAGGYPGLAACRSCTCGAARLYCFGGSPPARMQARPVQTPAPNDSSDAARKACPLVDAGEVGCTALPVSCTNQNEKLDCPCLLALLQPLYDCALDCAYDGDTSTVLCQNP